MKSKFNRSQRLAEKIVFVDGFSKSGKSLIAPLLSTFKNAELWKPDHLFEYLCTLDHFGKIDRDAAAALIRLYADLDLYNLMIGRETNLRPSDISSAPMNLLEERYRKRLRQKDGDVIVRLIRKFDPLLILMTHSAFGTTGLLFEALKERLKLYVLTLRHPFWLVEGWYQGDRNRGSKRVHGGDWHNRIGRDPRDFHLTCEKHNATIPWFAAEWAEEYLALNPLEQSIRMMSYFFHEFEKRYHAMPSEERTKVLFVPFESLVSNPSFHINHIVKMLDASPTALTAQMLKKLKLPYKVQKNNLSIQRKKIASLMKKEGVSQELQNVLTGLAADYEAKYLSYEAAAAFQDAAV